MDLTFLAHMIRRIYHEQGYPRTHAHTHTQRLRGEIRDHSIFLDTQTRGSLRKKETNYCSLGHMSRKFGSQQSKVALLGRYSGVFSGRIKKLPHARKRNEINWCHENLIASVRPRCNTTSAGEGVEYGEDRWMSSNKHHPRKDIFQSDLGPVLTPRV